MNLRAFFFTIPLTLLLCCSPEARRAGVTVTVVDALDLPCLVDSLVELEEPEVALALGEYESMAFLVSAKEALNSGEPELKGLPEGLEAELFQITPHRRKLRRNREITYPYFIEKANAVTVKGGESEVYYLTFKAAEKTVPGDYRVKLSLAGANAKFKLKIRPYRLRRDHGVIFGAFCGSRDTRITEEHMLDLAARGFDALQFFWGRS